MGREICLDRTGLAPSLAGGHPLLQLRSGDPQDHLHDQCHREPEPRDPEIHQDARLIPDGRGGDQADIPRQFEKDGRNVREWFAARNQFAIMFAERFDA